MIQSRRHAYLVTGASALALLAACPAMAQTAPDASAPTRLEEVVVTAQRRSENLQNVPIAVSAFSQKSLEAQKIDGGPNLQRAVPNVTFSKGFYSGYNFQIRGIGTKQTSVTGDTSTGVHINGAPLTENRLFEAEFFDVERVEVLRGPQGTLYGRNATGGVVNVITAKPKGEFEAAIMGELSSYEGRKARGMVNLPIAGDKLAVRLAGSYIKRDGFSDNVVTGHDVDDRDLYSIRATVAFNPTDNFSTYLMWNHFRESDKRLSSQKALCTKDNGPASVGGVAVTNAIARGLLSQGCTDGSLYSPNAFGEPNSLTTIYGLLGQLSGFTTGDVFTGTQIRDLDKIASRVDPSYKTTEDIYEFSATWDISPTLQFNSLTSYYDGKYDAQADQNRFQAAVPFNNTVYSPGGFISDPQLGSTNLAEIYNGNRHPSKQTSQEFRLQSSFPGALNFNVGANYVDYKTVQAFYIQSNLFTGRANFANGGVPCPLNTATCIYINPNATPDPSGHGNYLSYQPYKLKSKAVFGELYWQATDALKLTGGLRYTDDKKTLQNFPVKLLTLGSGLTPGNPAEYTAQFKELTGRLGFDWKPEVSFTDSTLVYAFYSRGYKGGGPNNIGQVVGPRPIYDPEFVNAYEVGTKNTLMDGKLQANLTGFYYDYKGYQISKFVNRISTTENIDATIMGAELEAIWEPVRNLRFNFSGGLLNTKIQSGNSIDPMRRTNGDPNFTLVKTSAASACIVPTAALATLLANPATQATPTSLLGVCSGAFAAQGVVPNDGVATQLKGKDLPNSPHWTASIGAQYTWNLANGWNVVLRGDYYQQGASYARVFNDEVDRLRGWKNANFSLQLAKPENSLEVEVFVKNAFNDRPITDAFLVDDAEGIESSVFTLDPRIIGVSVSKAF